MYIWYIYIYISWTPNRCILSHVQYLRVEGQKGATKPTPRTAERALRQPCWCCVQCRFSKALRTAKPQAQGWRMILSMNFNRQKITSKICAALVWRLDFYLCGKPRKACQASLVKPLVKWWTKTSRCSQHVAQAQDGTSTMLATRVLFVM